MRILMIEDDAYWENQIKQNLLQIQFDLNLDLIIDVRNQLDVIHQETSVDLILMDIEIGEDNSLNYYQSLYQLFPTSYFCYVTSHTDYMPDAFGINVCGYVVKSDLTKLKKIILKVLKLMEEKGKWFETVSGKQLISYHDILYFTSINKKIYLHTKDEAICLNDRGISSLLGTLPSYFVLINKQEIINLDQITFVSRDRLDLNRKQMPFVISRRKYNDVIEQFIKRVKEAVS